MEGEKTKSPTKIYPFKKNEINEWIPFIPFIPFLPQINGCTSLNVETKLIEQQDYNNLLQPQTLKKGKKCIMGTQS
jgi:hypothetical protein